MPVADALERILTGVMPLGAEPVGLRFALGRTLAQTISADITHPPFDASAMDGYAVRADDLKALPASLKVIGESAAGWPFSGTVHFGDAVRIFTGAAVPPGADAIVIQEDAVLNGKSVTIASAPPRGDYIRPRGQDFSKGDIVLEQGRVLNARDVMLAASSGHGVLNVVKRPIVAILATGDELVEPTERLHDGQIISSNSYGLAALVETFGGFPKLLGIARDTIDDLAEKIREAESADILITTGGASVGDHDLVRPALEAEGVTLIFYKIAMRPGKPMFLGTRKGAHGTQRVIGLPGNPLSAMIGARVFLVPLMHALLGQTTGMQTLTARLAVSIPANGPRDHYMRAVLNRGIDPLHVTPSSNQDSSLVSILAAANCLMLIPANSPALPVGATVTVMPLDF